MEYPTVRAELRARRIEEERFMIEEERFMRQSIVLMHFAAAFLIGFYVAALFGIN